MKTQSRKGQAAMEFIMTYGWAILVVLVAIGALAYFGVLSPTKYLPERCTISPGFNCKDYRLQSGAAGTDLVFNLAIENKQGEAVSLQSVNATTVYAGTLVQTNCGVAANTVIPADGLYSFTCTLASASPGTGQKGKASMAITYKDVQGVYNHVANVEVQAEVTP